MAIKKSNLVQVKALIEANPVLSMVKDETGSTPLHYAAMQENPEILLQLIIKGRCPTARM